MNYSWQILWFQKPSSAPLDFASELAKKLKGPGAAPAEENEEEEEPVKETKETKPKGQYTCTNEITV